MIRLSISIPNSWLVQLILLQFHDSSNIFIVQLMKQNRKNHVTITDKLFGNDRWDFQTIS